ncbi:MAG: hypothetical protein R3345_07550, partial [Fulvivirga sp.]|nr:hypothetical protein [Fulvivirga sp.]
YIKDENKVEIHKVREVGDVGLINQAVIQTIQHGGKVYILPEDSMPAEGSAVNAVFRYEM